MRGPAISIAAMQERMIFREVARIGAYTSPPDVVATVKRIVGGDAPLPFITFLTLGLVPTIATDTQRWEVTFAAPDTKPVVHVVVEHDGTVVIGLAGFLATVAPGWMSARTHHVRTFDHLALAIARKSDALRALAGR